MTYQTTDQVTAGCRWKATKRKLFKCALAASLVSTVCLSGCSFHSDWLKNGRKVGPNYCKPAAPVANSWIDFNDPRVIADPANDRDWWGAFNDPSLDMLVDAAYCGNLPLREQGQRVMEYRARGARHSCR